MRRKVGGSSTMPSTFYRFLIQLCEPDVSMENWRKFFKNFISAKCDSQHIDLVEMLYIIVGRSPGILRCGEFSHSRRVQKRRIKLNLLRCPVVSPPFAIIPIGNSKRKSLDCVSHSAAEAFSVCSSQPGRAALNRNKIIIPDRFCPIHK